MIDDNVAQRCNTRRDETSQDSERKKHTEPDGGDLLAGIQLEGLGSHRGLFVR